MVTVIVLAHLIEDLLGLNGAKGLLITLISHAVQELLQLAAHQCTPGRQGGDVRMKEKGTSMH